LRNNLLGSTNLFLSIPLPLLKATTPGRTAELNLRMEQHNETSEKHSTKSGLRHAAAAAKNDVILMALQI